MADNHRIHVRFALPDRSYLSAVRRDIARLIDRWQFDATDAGRIARVVAELTSNLVKHTTAGGGELLVRALPGESETGAGRRVDGVELLCFDTGPGIADPARMLEDGISTAGSAGQGLGAIRRAAEVFDFYTEPAHGTALLVRLSRGRRPLSAPAANWRCGAIVVPKPGQEACGDGWGIRAHPGGGVQLLALDGLGHGPEAELATLTAITAFEQSTATAPDELLRELHHALRGTRGAVAAVADLTLAGALTYCGVGNISARLASGQASRNLLSSNGIVGYALNATLLPQVTETTYYHWLVLASDGLQTRWELSSYPKLHLHDPSLIAAVLYRDQHRGTDDTLVLVAACRSVL